MVILYSMKRPIYVRPLSDAERNTLEAGLPSPDAFTLRRCQILLASADDQNAYQIVRNLGCNAQTARNAIHKFNEEGLKEALRRGSKRPHTVHRIFDEKGMEALREMLHRSPREFGKVSSLWTLAMAAEVSFEEGLTKESGYLGKRSGLPWPGWGFAGKEPSIGSPLPIRYMREKN